MLSITKDLAIDPAEITETFVRASGPGGQNVNKVATAVELRFDARGSPSLPQAARTRLERIAGSRLNRAGVIVISADRYRSQARNRADARQRLIALLRQAAEAPRARRATKPPASAKRRREEGKRRRAALKARRQSPSAHEE